MYGDWTSLHLVPPSLAAMSENPTHWFLADGTRFQDSENRLMHYVSELFRFSKIHSGAISCG